jgi:hypothetical protein
VLGAEPPRPLPRQAPVADVRGALCPCTSGERDGRAWVVVAGLTGSPGPGEAAQSPQASGLVQEMKTPDVAAFARSGPGGLDA